MADEPTGGGNPNFFKTFKGKYSLTPSSEGVWDTPTVMLSCTNDVQIIGDCTLDGYTAGDVIGTLPPECRPAKTVGVPVVAAHNVDVLYIDPQGTLKLASSFSETAPVMTSGINFNISSNWY